MEVEAGVYRWIELGSYPFDEEIGGEYDAQDDGMLLALLYRDQLVRAFPSLCVKKVSGDTRLMPVLSGLCVLGVRKLKSSWGMYPEVVAEWNDSSGRQAAYTVEQNLPARWDALSKIRLYSARRIPPSRQLVSHEHYEVVYRGHILFGRSVL